MPGQEERQLRTEKKLQKRRVSRQSRARAKKALLDQDFEQAAHDEEIPAARAVAHIHVGRNKPQVDKRRSGKSQENSPRED